MIGAVIAPIGHLGNVRCELTHDFLHCGGSCAIHSRELRESTLCLPSLSSPSPSLTYCILTTFFYLLFRSMRVQTHLHMFRRVLAYLDVLGRVSWSFSPWVFFAPSIHPERSLLRSVFSLPFPLLTYYSILYLDQQIFYLLFRFTRVQTRFDAFTRVRSVSEFYSVFASFFCTWYPPGALDSQVSFSFTLALHWFIFYSLSRSIHSSTNIIVPFQAHEHARFRASAPLGQGR